MPSRISASTWKLACQFVCFALVIRKYDAFVPRLSSYRHKTNIGDSASRQGTEHDVSSQQTDCEGGWSHNGVDPNLVDLNGLNGDQNQSPHAPEVDHWTQIMTGLMETEEQSNVNKWDNVLSDYDLGQIEKYWVKLMPTVSYLGTEQVSRVWKALCVAYRAHRGQARKSGEPFIIHPVEVAVLLASLKMDGETIIAGLLHDTVEDTDLTFSQVEIMFGYTVRSIVEGETKVSKLPKIAFNDYADEQAENLRQMFVAMTDDYRIIIVKLADRLHNMRTLQHMKPEKQVKISRETLDIFAPLAHRMGIWQFKSELEDTAFMYLYPQEYKRLSRRLLLQQEKYQTSLENAREIMQNRLQLDPTLMQQTDKVEVFGRTKEIYSLWHKMETKGERNLDNIIDVVALRVVITPRSHEGEDLPLSDRGVWLCYHVLGLVQHLPGFTPVPTRVKDYISFPKPNGYQSLHTALILDGQTIEVQIRTNTMHQVAEYGMASHWSYTDLKRGGDELYNTPWLASIKEWQDDMISSRDFVDSVRRELLGKRVFVFLRNGKILNLSRGSTVIDAAFQIHTEVGLNMHGVEINGKPVPLSYELRNGDVVSVLTGQGKPQTDWMRYAKSRSTRSKLRAYFRARQRENLVEAGRFILSEYLAEHTKLIEKNSHMEKPFIVPIDVDHLDAFLPIKGGYESVEDMLTAIGKDDSRSLIHTIVSQLFLVPKRIMIEAEQTKPQDLPDTIRDAVKESQRRANDAAIAITQANRLPSGEELSVLMSSKRKNLYCEYSLDSLLDSNVPTEYADPEHICEDCLPVPGDQIVGTRPPDGVSITTVHRVGCAHAQRVINNARAPSFISDRSSSGNSSNYNIVVDSVSLRQNVGGWPASNSRTISRFVSGTSDIPVRLLWSDFDEKECTFFTEVLVHAEDRKLLLADCSEVVSETVEIVKTGSVTTQEHAKLIFLVKVTGIEQIQKLMDRLALVRSVLSVERRFGSELN